MQDVEGAFGRVAKARRTRQNMSQVELAKALATRGVILDASAISRIESGDRTVRLAEAAAIADVLGMPLLSVSLDAPDDLREQGQRLIQLLDDDSRTLDRLVVDGIEHLTRARELVEELQALDNAEAARIADALTERIKRLLPTYRARLESDPPFADLVRLRTSIDGDHGVDQAAH